MRAHAVPNCASYRDHLWAVCKKQAEMKRSRRGRYGVQKRTSEIKGARAKPKSLNRATYSALRHCPLQPLRVLLFTFVRCTPEGYQR